MAYICIKDNKELNGVYYFSSLAMGESISEQVGECSFYRNSDKNIVLKEYNIKEEDIKDGRILINWCKSNERFYLGISETLYAGVYVFKHQAVRDRIAKNFDSAVTSNSKSEIVLYFKIKEADIKDGGILLSSNVQNWLANRKKKLEKEEKQKAKKSNVVIVEKSKNSEETVASLNQPFIESDILEQMIQAVASKEDEETKNNDVVEIVMSTGMHYRIALHRFFYMSEGCNFSNCAYSDNEGNVILKENLIDDMLKIGDIAVVQPSTIKYKDGFVILLNCDDEYSPDVEYEKTGKINIKHSISRIVLNVSQIVSVIGLESYSEINLTKIQEDKNALVYNYLNKKFKGK